MATGSDENPPNRSVRGRIIEDAMVNCHEARADVLKAQQLAGTVDREYRLRLQQAIIEYYYAMRPLREHNAIKDWWEDVVLSERWVKDRRTEQKVTGSVVDGVSLEEETVEEYYRGLDHIERLQDMRERRRTVDSGMMGKRESVEEVQKVLETAVLIDIAGTLDDAAAKLGFEPGVPDSAPRTKITEEALEEVKKWREQNI